MNITIPLDPQNKIPLYEQIIRYLRRAMEEGRLTPGERLPSKRALAEHLHVSISTVETAYAQLVAEGYLAAHARSGFYVEQQLPGRIPCCDDAPSTALPNSTVPSEEEVPPRWE